MTIVCLVAMISVNAQTDDLYERKNDLIKTASKLSKNKKNRSSYNGLWYCDEYDTIVEINYPTQITIKKNGETIYILCKKMYDGYSDGIYNHKICYRLPVFGDCEEIISVNITRFKEDLIVLDVSCGSISEAKFRSRSYKLIKQ